MKNKTRLALVALVTALLSLIVIVQPASAHSSACTTGQIQESANVTSTGSYSNTSGTYADGVKLWGSNANNMALDVDWDVFDSNGTRLAGITEYRDGDGKYTFYPVDIRLNNSPYVRFVFDRGTLYADCTIRLAVH